MPRRPHYRALAGVLRTVNHNQLRTHRASLPQVTIILALMQAGRISTALDTSPTPRDSPPTHQGSGSLGGVMLRVGFEPTKAEPAVLQTVPVVHLGISA